MRHRWRTLGISCLAIAALAAPSPAAGSQDGRAVSLKIMADQECRRIRNWDGKILDSLGQVAVEFRTRFGLDFHVRLGEMWTSDNGIRSLDALAESFLSSAAGDDANIVIGVTGRKNLDPGLSGYALFNEGVAVVRWSADAGERARTLKHEIGHFFGAVHVPDPGSVMDYFAQGESFDEGNARAILLFKSRRFRGFGFPLPASALPEALDIYGAIAARVEAFLSPRSKPALQDGVHGVLGKDGKIDPFYLDDVYCLLARIHLEMKDYDQSLEMGRAALRINPRSAEARVVMGTVFRRQGRLDEALESYRAALEVSQAPPKVLYNMGIAYARKGDLESAVTSYERALSAQPRFAEARNNLAEVELALGRDEDAEKEIRLALESDPRFALAHSNLAELQFRKRNWEDALTETDRALLLEPELPAAHNIRGNIFVNTKRLDEAIAEYGLALERDPENGRFAYNLGLAWFRKGEFRKSLELVLRAAELGVPIEARFLAQLKKRAGGTDK